MWLTLVVIKDEKLLCAACTRHMVQHLVIIFPVGFEHERIVWPCLPLVLVRLHLDSLVVTSLAPLSAFAAAESPSHAVQSLPSVHILLVCTALCRGCCKFAITSRRSRYRRVRSPLNAACQAQFNPAIPQRQEAYAAALDLP